MKIGFVGLGKMTNRVTQVNKNISFYENITGKKNDIITNYILMKKGYLIYIPLSSRLSNALQETL